MKAEYLHRFSLKKWLQIILVTVVVVLLTFEIRLFFHDYLGNHFPLIFFIFTTSILAYFFGARLGIIALSVSAVAAYYFFVKPYNSFQLGEISDLIYLIVKYILGVIVILLISWLKFDSKHFLDHH